MIKLHWSSCFQVKHIYMYCSLFAVMQQTNNFQNLRCFWVWLGLRLKGQRKYGVTWGIYAMMRKSFQHLPSTIIFVAGSESVVVIQRKYNIGHRCKAVLHVPAKSNTQHDTKSNKRVLFYLHSVMWCGKMFVKSRSSLMTLDRFSSLIAIQSQTNLILIEEKVYYFPRTNSSQQIPSWVIYD